MIDKEQAEKYLASSMTETALQYMARSYAVNVMILRRLALIFQQQQTGRPLTDEEIRAVSDANQALQVESENRAVADLHKHLRDESHHAVAAGMKAGGATEQ